MKAAANTVFRRAAPPKTREQPPHHEFPQNFEWLYCPRCSPRRSLGLRQPTQQIPRGIGFSPVLAEKTAVSGGAPGSARAVAHLVGCPRAFVDPYACFYITIRNSLIPGINEKDLKQCLSQKMKIKYDFYYSLAIFYVPGVLVRGFAS